jgi:hypothetical protein
MDNKKQKLIEALQRERVAFEERGFSTLEHDIVIKYLETGTTTEDPYKYELLEGCMCDYETMLSDYNIS